MVIIATYLLFVTGSVALAACCRKQMVLLSHQPFDFGVLHGLSHEAQRSGAGFYLYFVHHGIGNAFFHGMSVSGAEDSLRSRYPRNLVVDAAFLEEADTVPVRAAVDEVLTPMERKRKTCCITVIWTWRVIFSRIR